MSPTSSRTSIGLASLTFAALCCVNGAVIAQTEPAQIQTAQTQTAQTQTAQTQTAQTETGVDRAWRALDTAPIPGQQHVLHFQPTDAGRTTVPSRIAPARTPASANITVTFNGFSPAAQTAFQYAIDLIEPLIDSPQEIRVDATWGNLQTCQPGDACILGGAGTNFLRGLTFQGGDTFFFPDALADALIGDDLGPGQPDIFATFNSGYPNWYMGTDGNPPSVDVDFVTVVLHELLHGLGFSGSAVVDNGAAPVECNGMAGIGCFGYGQNIPAFYDVWVDSPIGTELLSYTNTSAALGTALQNNQVHWQGESARSVVGGAIQLYSPSTFQRGSSYSHWDEATFGPGNPHSLMTPSVGSAEVIHDPGAALCLFKDLLWTVNVSCESLIHDGWDTADFSIWSQVSP
jgi:hypothetical protein